MQPCDKDELKKLLVWFTKILVACLSITIAILTINLYYSNFVLKMIFVIASYLTKCVGAAILIFLLICIYIKRYKE